METKKSEYKLCKRCVMDTTDPDITFDENDVCNHCHTYDERKSTYESGNPPKATNLLNILEEIQKNKSGKYDCVIGMSGGIDSSYVAYKAITFGLHPIAFHIDNEWDSDIAVQNIKKITTKLGIPLENIGVNWEEFKDLQLSFLKSSTPDVEVPTDHAVISVPYLFTKKHNVKYILTGYNYKTESHHPRTWSSAGQMDWDYIKAVHKMFGTVPLKTFPHITPLKYSLLVLHNPLKKIDILNYIDYDKTLAMDTLHKEFGYEYYGAKHWESIYTRFLQTFILPYKFGIDKRKVHLSSLVCSGIITREQALEELSKPPMDSSALQKDREFVLNKLDITDEYFMKLMNLPPKSYWDYPHSKLFDSNFVKNVAKNILKRKGI